MSGIFQGATWDGSDGETHVEPGARIMRFFFGDAWGDFTAAHSRYWAKRNGLRISRLCVADKLAFVLTPAWMYLPMTRATGELDEYLMRARERQAGSVHFTDEESRQLRSANAGEWLDGLKNYARRRIEQHRNGCEDTWTVTGTRRIALRKLTGAWRALHDSERPVARIPYVASPVDNGRKKMAQQFDVSLKLLFHHSRGLIARRLFGGPVVEWVNVEQPKVTNLRADLLARLEDGSLRHVEVQAKNEPEMGRGQAEYYLGFHRLLRERVEQIVLCIGREPLRMRPALRNPGLYNRTGRDHRRKAEYDRRHGE
jgi:hypothetical protein